MSNFVKIIVFLFVIFILGSCKKPNVYSVADYLELAKCFDKNKEDKKAIEFYEKVLQLDPKNIIANVKLAHKYSDLNEFEKVLSRFEILTKLKPIFSKFFYDMGYIFYYKFGDLRSAVKSITKYLELHDPDVNSLIRSNIILHDSYAKLGDFKKFNEHHKCVEKVIIDSGMREEIYKEWDGSDPKGKTILLRDNVGIGDIFCWIRFAKILKDKGAKVVLEARKFLIPILSKFNCIDGFITKGSKAPHFDFQVAVGQIPFYFVEKEKDLEIDIPYAKADTKLVNFWKQKLEKDKNFKIGICWDPCQYKGNSGKPVSNNRAMPIHYFLPLSRLQNVSLYSLQQINGIDQLEKLPSYFRIKTFSEGFDRVNGSFSDTAAVMKNLDLVITVDTSVAHLAGALGVNVWTLLPIASDWRWLADDSKTSLYPTMRLFRQKKLGDWESVMSNVIFALEKIL